MVSGRELAPRSIRSLIRSKQRRPAWSRTSSSVAGASSTAISSALMHSIGPCKVGVTVAKQQAQEWPQVHLGKSAAQPLTTRRYSSRIAGEKARIRNGEAPKNAPEMSTLVSQRSSRPTPGAINSLGDVLALERPPASLRLEPLMEGGELLAGRWSHSRRPLPGPGCKASQPSAGFSPEQPELHRVAVLATGG